MGDLPKVTQPANRKSAWVAEPQPLGPVFFSHVLCWSLLEAPRGT